MNKIILSLFIGGLYFTCHAQGERMYQIDHIVKQINHNDKLTSTLIDAHEVYGQPFDGGGTIKVSTNHSEIVKIEQEIGLSYGRLTTIIYLTAGKPIQIIDREENFKRKENQTSWDYTTMKQVFEATIYVFDWDKDDSKVIYRGKRIMSEGTCSNYEYEPLLAIVRRLVKK